VTETAAGKSFISRITDAPCLHALCNMRGCACAGSTVMTESKSSLHLLHLLLIQCDCWLNQAKSAAFSTRHFHPLGVTSRNQGIKSHFFVEFHWEKEVTSKQCNDFGGEFRWRPNGRTLHTWTLSQHKLAHPSSTQSFKLAR